MTRSPNSSQGKSLKEIAALIDGEVIGESSLIIGGVADLSQAQKQDLVFAFDAKNLAQAESSSAVAVVTFRDAISSKKALIRVDNPRLSMAKILALFVAFPDLPSGIHKTVISGAKTKIATGAAVGAYTVIGQNTQIKKEAIIYPQVYIGSNCVVEEGSIIYPHVTIYHDVKIGKGVIIHSGTVIGADGFGYEKVDGKYHKIPHVGKIIIEDDVEIQANSCVDRATVGETIIKRGTKIDNLVQVAHNCEVGEDCAIAAHTALTGGVTFEDGVVAGGQVGVSNHLRVGKDSLLLARSGVTKNISPKSVVSGFPAHDHKKEMELQGLLHRLPQLFKKISDLEKRLNP